VVVTLDRLEQLDPLRLDSIAAGATLPLAGVEVRGDLLPGELSQRQLHGDDRGALEQRLLAPHRERGVEAMNAASHRRELAARLVAALRLAQEPALEIGRLVRADDERVGKALRDGLGLAHGEQAGGAAGRDVRADRLVDAGRDGLEGDARGAEQRLPGARGGGEDDGHGEPRERERR